MLDADGRPGNAGSVGMMSDLSCENGDTSRVISAVKMVIPDVQKIKVSGKLEKMKFNANQNGETVHCR